MAPCLGNEGFGQGEGVSGAWDSCACVPFSPAAELHPRALGGCYAFSLPRGVARSEVRSWATLVSSVLPVLTSGLDWPCPPRAAGGQGHMASSHPHGEGLASRVRGWHLMDTPIPLPVVSMGLWAVSSVANTNALLGAAQCGSLVPVTPCGEGDWGSWPRRVWVSQRGCTLSTPVLGLVCGRGLASLHVAVAVLCPAAVFSLLICGLLVESGHAWPAAWMTAVLVPWGDFSILDGAM